jgi:hypothetical protein
LFLPRIEFRKRQVQIAVSRPSFRSISSDPNVSYRGEQTLAIATQEVEFLPLKSGT